MFYNTNIIDKKNWKKGYVLIMNNYSTCFNTLYKKFTTWTWKELLFGIKNNIIKIEDVINYTNYIISKDNEDFEDIMKIIIVNADEVEPIVEELASKEQQKEDNIISKWIFMIIYYYYKNNNKNIYNVIDDIYCDFNYPSEISGLVSYMPKEGTESLDDKLVNYIKNGEGIWFIKSIVDDNVMIIKEIEYLDSQNGEAYVTLVDDKLEIKCFMYESHPLKIKINDKVKLNNISCLNVDNIFITDQKKFSIKYDDDKYSIICSIIDKANGIGNLNGIKIYIMENLPGDLNNGDFIEFITDRLDISENDIEIL